MLEILLLFLLGGLGVLTLAALVIIALYIVAVLVVQCVKKLREEWKK